MLLFGLAQLLWPIFFFRSIGRQLPGQFGTNRPNLAAKAWPAADFATAYIWRTSKCVLSGFLRLFRGANVSSCYELERRSLQNGHYNKLRQQLCMCYHTDSRNVHLNIYTSAEMYKQELVVVQHKQEACVLDHK